MLLALLGRWQVFTVVAVGLQTGLKYISLRVMEEQKQAQVLISCEFGLERMRK